jgi:nucleotide-binding universal stress UspA family protein
MIKIQRILCPTDLSPDSDQALLYAQALACTYEAKLIACHCARAAAVNGAGRGSGELVYALSQNRGNELFDGSLLYYLPPVSFASLGWQGVVVESEDIAEAIIQTAAEHGVDLIVMRSRRRPHRAALLGSTAESVCRTAPCPVLVTHGDEREWIDQPTGKIVLERVLVPYDFSDYSELALKYALSLAQEYQAELHVLHVLPPKTVNQPEIAWYPLAGEAAYHKATRRLQKAVPPEAHLWCQIKHAVREGQPYREVLSYAEKNKIDLISVGAHGAGFGMRALFGSNVDRILRQARCPVLVARPLRPKDARIFIDRFPQEQRQPLQQGPATA